MTTPFHLAIGVSCLKKAREFYGDLIGAKEGRSDSKWVDFNFFGHQLTCHLVEKANADSYFNSVDSQAVPIPHFGPIVPPEQFEALKTKLEKANTSFIVKPQIRFKGLPGEQKTMFFKDPFGHSIEIKSYPGKMEY
ncbi:MAG: hypothetical protein OXB86_02400 [Bdellovibrionales bacterium]|nr:hypothetical protein [Bdellovibrionales bacterium]